MWDEITYPFTHFNGAAIRLTAVRCAKHSSCSWSRSKLYDIIKGFIFRWHYARTGVCAGHATQLWWQRDGSYILYHQSSCYCHRGHVGHIRNSAHTAQSGRDSGLDSAYGLVHNTSVSLTAVIVLVPGSLHYQLHLSNIINTPTQENLPHVRQTGIRYKILITSFIIFST